MVRRYARADIRHCHFQPFWATFQRYCDALVITVFNGVSDQVGQGRMQFALETLDMALCRTAHVNICAFTIAGHFGGDLLTQGHQIKLFTLTFRTGAF